MRWFVLALCACVCAFGSCSLAADVSDSVKSEATSDSWTFIVYMAADNNLETAAISDFNEMEAATVPANVKILVLFDRSADYETSNGDWADTRLFEVQHDTSGLLASKRLSCPELELALDGETELNMANKTTLSALLTFAGREYPAAHYALIIWGHGTGWRSAEQDWTKAFAVDDESQAYMSIGDLRAGIQTGLRGVAEKLDFIGFDTCFGICMETAYELRDCAHFLAGTPALLPNEGWNYTDLFSSFCAGERTLSALTECALLQYKTQYATYGGASFSVVDCARVTDAVAAFDACAGAAANAITSYAEQIAYRNALNQKCKRYYASSFPCDCFIDVFNMAQLLPELNPALVAVSDDLLSALCAAVPLRWNPSGAETGIGAFWATYIASGTVDVAHPDLYMAGSLASNQCQFVRDCTNYVPSALGSGSLLDKIFYTSFEE